MAYSGISIQALGNSGGGPSTVADVQILRNAGIETLGIQIKPSKRKAVSNPKITWQQALDEELNWALEMVLACNDSELRQIKVVIRFNDLVSNDPPNLIEMNTDLWWDTYTPISLGFWDQVCQKFVGHEIYMFEIYSEPARVDNRPDSPYPIKSELENFYQEALDIVRLYNNYAYFLLSPGPFGRFTQYLHGFTPFNIIDAVRPYKLMYGFHMYIEHKYTHQGIHGKPRPYFYPSPVYDIIKLNQDFDAISSWSIQYGYPIYMGEFNAARWSPNAIDWVKDVILNAKQADFHWSFFAYKPNFEVWDPYWEVDNPQMPDPADWTIAYLGPNTLLWQFLLTQF
jgi:hypothetical protein